MTGLNGFDK